MYKYTRGRKFDLYLESLNLWIEIDGIDHEKRKKWLGKQYDYWKVKLEIYKEKKLNLLVVKGFDESKELITKEFLK